MNYHSLLTVSMPLLVLGICITDSLHYYLIHLSARLTSLKFSRCSFIAPQQVYIGASISLSQTARSSPHMGFNAAGCVLLQRATLPSPLPLCPHYWRLTNLFLSLAKLALRAMARSSVLVPCPLMSLSGAPLNDIQVQWHCQGCSIKCFVSFRRMDI